MLLIGEHFQAQKSILYLPTRQEIDPLSFIDFVATGESVVSEYQKNFENSARTKLCGFRRKLLYKWLNISQKLIVVPFMIVKIIWSTRAS